MKAVIALIVNRLRAKTKERQRRIYSCELLVVISWGSRTFDDGFSALMPIL